MPDEYEYEVFISYRRDEAVYNWLNLHFYQALQRWLPQFLPPGHPSRIFVDWTLTPGQRWPEALQRGLKRSRCLMPIFTTQYFASEWCLAELRSMEAREKQLGIGTIDNTDGLIFPVIFADGKRFPPDTSRLIQRCDMSKWAFDNDSFKDTREYTGFISSVKYIAENVADMILRAPSWQDWPISTPPVPASADHITSMDNPTFGGSGTSWGMSGRQHGPR